MCYESIRAVTQVFSIDTLNLLDSMQEDMRLAAWKCGLILYNLME